MRGRKPTTKAVKEMTGAAFKNTQRVNHFEPKGNHKRPEMPQCVVEDPVASECWNSMCEELDQMSLLVTSDFYVLQIAAMCYSQIMALHKETKGGNVVVEAPRGGMVVHPAALQMHKFQDRFLKCLIELGLSPSGRLRLHAPDPEADSDEFQQWLSGTTEEPS